MSHRLRGEGGGEATKGGSFSHGRSPVVKVLYILAPSIILKAPTKTLSGEADVKLKPLKNLRPVGPSTLTPAGRVLQ